MTSKKELKKKYKELKQKVSELQNTSMGMLYVVTNIIKIYDSNMGLIMKTFKAIAEKINAIENMFEPLVISNENGIEIEKPE